MPQSLSGRLTRTTLCTVYGKKRGMRCSDYLITLLPQFLLFFGFMAAELALPIKKTTDDTVANNLPVCSQQEGLSFQVQIWSSTLDCICFFLCQSQYASRNSWKNNRHQHPTKFWQNYVDSNLFPATDTQWWVENTALACSSIRVCVMEPRSPLVRSALRGARSGSEDAPVCVRSQQLCAPWALSWTPNERIASMWEAGLALSAASYREGFLLAGIGPVPVQLGALQSTLGCAAARFLS